MKSPRFPLMNKTEMIIVTLLLMIWGSHATEPGTLLTNMSPDTGGPEGKDQLRFYESLSVPDWRGAGSPPKHLRPILPHNTSDSDELKFMNEMEYPQDTSYLKWVPIKDKQIPDGSVGIFNTYTSRRDFVCRAKDYCTFGFLNEGRGLLCFFPFRGYELHTDNFDVLVNIDDFELLEWKSGSTVPDPDIKFCQDNFVGKNEYGLGDVFKGYFYLPWEGKEIWYSSWDVLTISHDVFDVHYSDVTYDINLVNRTQHPPYTIKTSRVENHDDREVTETVHMEVTTVKANSWQSSFSSSLSQSTSISAGLPDIASAVISIGAVVTLTLTDGHLESESITQGQDVKVQVPPGYYCVVRMEGWKVEATIPYSGRVTKTYKNGKKLTTTVSGTYSGFQTGGINSSVDRCELIPTPAPKLKPSISCGTTLSVGTGSVLPLVFGLVTLFSVLVFGVIYSCRIYPFNIQKKHYFPVKKELV
ncbi:natterin-3-like isoform X2 [Clupea harengus]|uniref:Natterin-3-like isoform X2 n=1 Tax=Clupea harengus TaxID=7950 RepID=A0A6P8GB35_CLUHA|nr:natterin-3-like isoform X2 [Clupea harengus]